MCEYPSRPEGHNWPSSKEQYKQQVGSLQDDVDDMYDTLEEMEDEVKELKERYSKVKVVSDEWMKKADTLVKEGFTVLCYTSDDPVLAQRLEGVGVASVMPAGAPIGSGQGIQNPNNIRIILERAEVPVIGDAGVGTASDVSFAFELGAHGVLLNTAVALADEPVRMARAMRAAADAGRGCCARAAYRP